MTQSTSATTPKVLPKTQVSAMTSICKGLPTKSAKIRALAAKDYSRSEIAKFMGIRYQHVRNVLVTPLKRGPQA